MKTHSLKVTATAAVSYTHLDVYKRQVLVKRGNRRCRKPRKRPFFCFMATVDSTSVLLILETAPVDIVRSAKYTGPLQGRLLQGLLTHATVRIFVVPA